MSPSPTPAARMVRLLGTVSLICGVLIVATKLGTSERIRQNLETIMRDSVAELLPGIQKQIIYAIDPAGQVMIVPNLETQGPRLFAGYGRDNRFLGVVIETSDRGYADVISAMYAYSIDKQEITGFKVVDMRETPGLGDRVRSDPDFLQNFRALDVTHPPAVVKHGSKKNPWEIDAISGATISSRAVGRMLAKSVRDVVPIVLKDRERIEKGN